MPRYFFDTSALVKNYHAEAGTAEVQRILADASSEFLIRRARLQLMFCTVTPIVGALPSLACCVPRLTLSTRPVLVFRSVQVVAGSLITSRKTCSGSRAERCWARARQNFPKVRRIP